MCVRARVFSLANEGVVSVELDGKICIAVHAVCICGYIYIYGMFICKRYEGVARLKTG